MYIPHFLCPVIYQWTFSLLPPPGYCTYSWYNHGCSNISPIYFQFFYIYPEVRHIGHIINLCLIIQGTTILFYLSVSPCYLLQQCRVSNFSPSPLTLIFFVVCFGGVLFCLILTILMEVRYQFKESYESGEVNWKRFSWIVSCIMSWIFYFILYFYGCICSMWKFPD